MPLVRSLPLSWYVEKIEKGEPFTSLLYGDGEFLVMSGERTGQTFTQYREYVSREMVAELRVSLDYQGADIIRGTDPNLLNWQDYQGQDFQIVKEIGLRVERVIGKRKIDWVDGVVWDTAVKTGNLAPFLRALKKKRVMWVGCPALNKLPLAVARWFVYSLPENAYAEIDELQEAFLDGILIDGPPEVVIVCMGLGAIPLIMRLRRHLPTATFLDLGSTFDVFVGLGAERGWRAELYADPARLKEIIDRNLEGV